MLLEWIEKKYPGTEELAKLRNVEYVDLSAGHWPQYTKPAELAQAILASIDGRHG